MKRLLFLIFLFSLSGKLAAQHDSTYIQTLSHLLALKVSVNNEVDSFDLTVGDTRYEIYPNTSIHNSYTFSYRFLTFTVSLDPGALDLNSDTDTRGETQTIKYGTELRFNRFIQSVSYTSTKGYYLRNTVDFDPEWQDGDPYQLLPDLQYTDIRGITLMKWNPSLSIAALSAANTRQVKSIGTFIPNIAYRYYIIDDQTELIEGGTTQKSTNFEVSISPGYAHTFVFREHFYVSTGVFPGIGRIATNLTTRDLAGDIERDSRTWLYRMTLLTGVGYDTGRFYSGGRIQGTLLRQTQENVNASITQNEVLFEIFAGYRFTAPGFLKKGFDWIENVVPFL